jgi:hypothetical protein
MTQAGLQLASYSSTTGIRQGAMFFAAALALALTAAAMAGWVPLGFSIVTVFLFAGPHNWMEARFFLSQMPARWGPMRRYFQLAIAGVALLGVGYFLMPVMGRKFAWEENGWLAASAIWNSAFILWIAGLAALHGRNHPRANSPSRSRRWLWPLAFALVAAIWALPTAWDLVLVYLHPFIAILFLQRILARKRPQWLPAYYAVLAAVPLLLACLYLRLHDAPPLVGQDMLTMRITQHAGAGIITGVSAHFLVAAHTFLEMLHYGVWIAAVPLVALAIPGRKPWRTDGIPLARRSFRWRTVVTLIMAAGALLVIVLWAGFLADYPVTRDLYFTAAILHVLAEFPFLVRLL